MYLAYFVVENSVHCWCGPCISWFFPLPFDEVPANFPRTRVKLHSSMGPAKHAQRQTLIAFSVVGQALLFAGAACAQDAVRMSMASSEAAAARRQAASTLGYYNLKLGPADWRFGSTLGFEYNSNVYYRENGPGDFIIRPGLTAEMLCPLTQANSLNLSLGAGYSFYTQNTGLSRWFVTPGSELAFDIYSGDLWINLHDRFSIEQNSYQDPTVVGTGNYSRLQNTVGATTTWDLNKVVLAVTMDHLNFSTISGDATQPNGAYELGSIQAGYALQPETIVGTQVGGGYIQYSGQNVVFPSAIQWNAGMFMESPLTDHLRAKASAGYTRYSPETVVGYVEAQNFSGIYADMTLEHRLNEYLTYTLSGGRTIQLGFYSGAVDLYYARWNATWHLIEKVGLGTSLSYEAGDQFNGSLEQFQRWGTGLSLGRQLARKLNAAISYQFYSRTSDQAGGDYVVNIAGLNFNYTF